MNSYNDLLKFKNKNISQMVKEFVLTDLEKQRYCRIVHRELALFGQPPLC